MNLRDYQRDAIDAVYSYCRENPGKNPVIDIATGGGKSVVIGYMMKEIIQSKPNRRILMLSHVKELLEQNFTKLINVYPEADVGFYSASIGKKQVGNAITIAGIQSCYTKGNDLGFYHVVIIDEAHLISDQDSGMYRTLLTSLKKINPKLVIIGLSATPWRNKSGLLTEGDGALFDDIVYHVSMRDLIDMEYLVPLVGKSSIIQADLTNVGVYKGEYLMNDASLVFDNEELTHTVIDEILQLGKERKSWLIFTCGVDHSKHFSEALIKRGITSTYVTGDTPKLERANIIASLRNRELRAVTNNMVLTTGTDIPNIDMIVMLRPTRSPGLLIQMVGRGLRLSPETGKIDCLLLDYAGNIDRFGPIDMIEPPEKRAGAKPKTMPSKICPHCREAVAIATIECKCGYIFPQDETYKHTASASKSTVMSDDGWIDVTEIEYKRHRKSPSVGEDGELIHHPESLKVRYSSGNMIYEEWVCCEHTGFAKAKAVQWLLPRLTCENKYEMASMFMVEDAIENPDILKKPLRIRVKKEGKYWRVLAHQFE